MCHLLFCHIIQDVNMLEPTSFPPISSVAAGHDNCHYDCYEAQLERTLQGVFEAAGMKLIAQNAGEVSQTFSSLFFKSNG